MTKGKTLRQIFLAMLLILPLVFIMSACGHEHKYSEEWSKNAMEHWHVCTDKDCNEISDKAKHVYGEWQIVETATCTENGKRVKACSVCGYILEEQVIPAKNHNYGTPTYTWSDDKTTCTAKVVCGNDATHVITETVNVTTNPTPATCEADGEIKYTATFTNTTKFTTQTMSEKNGDKLGHNYGTPTYTWNEDKTTCTAKVVCGNDATHVITETVNVAKNTTPATCEADGNIEYTATFTNTTRFTTQTKSETINKLGHNYGTPTYTWSEDKATCTAKVVCSNDTTHVITETVEVAKNTTPATCEADGNIEYTATFTNTKFTTQTKSETINKLGHDYVDGTCTRCGDKRFAQIGEKYYASLQDAVKGAVSGDTITLLANVSIDKLIAVDKNLTIDFGGFTLTATSGVFDVAYNTAESGLILKNGKIDTAKWGVWLQKKGYLKVENNFEIIADNTGKVDTAAAVVVTEGAIADIYGKLSVNGESFTLSGNGTKGWGNVTINVHEGAMITARDIPVYMPNSDTLNIYGGTIKGKTAIYAKSGTTNLKGGTLVSTATKFENYVYYNNGALPTGHIVVVEACGYPGGNPVVNIETGVTYRFENMESVQSDKTKRVLYCTYLDNTATITNNDTENVEISNAKAVARVKFKDGKHVYGFQTLLDALTACADTSKGLENAITLIADIDYGTTEMLTISQNITIDFNGCTISAQTVNIGANLEVTFQNTKKGSNGSIVKGGIASQTIGVTVGENSKLTFAFSDSNPTVTISSNNNKQNKIENVAIKPKTGAEVIGTFIEEVADNA